MALPPCIFTEDFKSEIDFFEDYIDNALARQTIINNSSISIDLPTDFVFTKHHFIILREKYKIAGWKNMLLGSNSDANWINLV